MMNILQYDEIGVSGESLPCRTGNVLPGESLRYRTENVFAISYTMLESSPDPIGDKLICWCFACWRPPLCGIMTTAMSIIRDTYINSIERNSVPLSVRSDYNTRPLVHGNGSSSDNYVQSGTYTNLIGNKGHGLSCDHCGRSGTCTYLLGNKGCHIYNGNSTLAEKSADETTLTRDSAEIFNEVVYESVGGVCIDAEDTGVGFRVGKRRFMTAYHVLRDEIDNILDDVVIRLDKSDRTADDLSKRLDVSVDPHKNIDDTLREIMKTFLNKTGTNVRSLFESIRGLIDTDIIIDIIIERWNSKFKVKFLQHGEFIIDWNIQFGDNDKDFIIVNLKETIQEQTFPKPLPLDEKLRYGNFIIIMYKPESEEYTVCQKCMVYEDDSSLQQDVKEAFEDFKELKLSARDNDVDDNYIKQQYEKGCWRAHDDVSGHVIMRTTKSFIEGSSGSPIVRVDSRDHCSMIYQAGLPRDLYKMKKNYDIPEKCLFQTGTTMEVVAKTLIEHGKTVLKQDIFSIPVIDEMSLKTHTAEIDRKYCHMTKGIRAAIDKMKSGSYVCVTGARKAGKTKAVRRIALYFWDRGYFIYHVETLEEFIKIFDHREHQLFVFDDFLGKSLCEQKRYQWSVHSQIVGEVLQSSKNTKLVCSLEVTIYFDQKYKGSDCLFLAGDSRTIHLSQQDNAIDIPDQKKMLKCHLMFRDIGNSDEIIDRTKFCRLEKPLACFYPLLCEYFCEKHFSGDVVAKKDLSMVDDLFPALVYHFKQMKNTNKIQFCVLVLCAVIGDKFTCDIVSALAYLDGIIDKETVDNCDKIMKLFDLKIPDNLLDIKSALASLDGTYINLNPTTDTYELSNPQIGDAVLHAYDDKCLVEKYCTHCLRRPTPRTET